MNLRALWWRVSESLWLIPAVLVLGATLLATGLIYVDERWTMDLSERWPLVFGVGAESARGLLSALATTMLTVAGTVFSVTLAVLSLAASQYSPRVIRTFINDRPTQGVLGVFVAIFVYCLIVLRTVRGGEAQEWVPSLAVLGALVLALVAIAFLVYFIHHLAASIEASSILRRIAAGTRAAIGELFPEHLGVGAPEYEEDGKAQAIGTWTALPARRSDYIVSVNNDALLAFARKRNRVLRMELAIGDFAVEGLPLAALEGSGAVTDEDIQELNRCYAFESRRTINQDAAFGLQEIVDMGLKALSAGINDQSTAVMCLDRLSELLAELARRRIESPYRREESEPQEDGETGQSPLRVIARGPTFPGLLVLSFRDLCESASGKPAVLGALLAALERIGVATGNPLRRAALAAEVARVTECVRRTVASPRERDLLLLRAAQLEQRLSEPVDLREECARTAAPA